MRDIPRTAPCPYYAQIWVIGQGRGNTGIDYLNVDSSPARQYIDRRTAGQEVKHHLRCDLLGITGYALRNHTMVSRRDNQRLATDYRSGSSKHPCNLNGQALQPPQTARRLN